MALNETNIRNGQLVSNRRNLLKTLGTGGVGAAALLAGVQPARADAASDLDILNFALNLEYLEAEFYSIATRGQGLEALGIDITGSGTPGPSNGASQVTFPDEYAPVGQLAYEVAHNERLHVRLVRDTIQKLGGTPIAKPAIDYAAMGFDGSFESFLVMARAFEDTGLSAYIGASPLITDKDVLLTSARIIGTEAEHVMVFRLQLSALNIPTVGLDPVDVPPIPTGPKFTSTTDGYALTRARTAAQVLYIVYGQKEGVTSGGLFPNGVNGNIVMSGAPATP